MIFVDPKEILKLDPEAVMDQAHAVPEEQMAKWFTDLEGRLDIMDIGMMTGVVEESRRTTEALYALNILHDVLPLLAGWEGEGKLLADFLKTPKECVIPKRVRGVDFLVMTGWFEVAARIFQHMGLLSDIEEEPQGPHLKLFAKG